MAVAYRTSGAWGFGSSEDLSAEIIDNNFWTLVQRLLVLEANPVAAGIDYFSLTGALLTVHMTDHSTRGPYQIPVPEPDFQGTWAPSTLYSRNALVSYSGTIYVVLLAHTSALTFDANATDGHGGDLYRVALSFPELMLPTGGLTGQVLAKSSNANFAFVWSSSTVIPGGATGELLAKFSDNDFDQVWVSFSDLISEVRLGQLYDVGVGGAQDGDVLMYYGGVNPPTTAGWSSQPAAKRGSEVIQISGISWQPIPNGDEFVFALVNNEVATTIYLPTGFAIDTEITVCQDGDGYVQFQSALGATVDFPIGMTGVLFGKGAVAMAKVVSFNRWRVFGLLTPVG